MSTNKTIDKNSKKEETVELKSLQNGNEEPTEEKSERSPNNGDNKEETQKSETVSFLALFRYADKLDVFLISIACIVSIAHGSLIPTQLLVFGGVLEEFIESAKNETEIKIEEKTKTFALYFVGLSGLFFIFAFLQATLWSVTAARQVQRIRGKFFQSILRQDIGWFDVNEVGGLTTKLSDDLTKIQSGIGDKIGLLLHAFAAFLGGIALGFIYSWKLTLVMFALLPAVLLGGSLVGKLVGTFSAREQKAYAFAGAIAEEAISSIRTVAALGGQKDEINRYNAKLMVAEKAGTQKALTLGISFGFFYFAIYACYAVAFWYGSNLVANGEITSGDLITVFFAVVFGAAQLGQVAPHFESISTARGVAYFMFEICDRDPIINCLSEEGKTINNIEGEICFSGVHFQYPSRPEVKILKDFDLQLSPGSTVALVGESGCGKSTIVKLIQRLYDTQQGSVKLDNIDLKELNVKWFRSNIGVVSQEPVLFDMSIAENIKLGATSDVSNEEIETAAKLANAHDFIMTFPKGYNTSVGELGSQLSGGQKQRIAIARALIRDPKILLLDEATSSLDTESEKIVQAALSKASEGRTTVIVAHRLSTIRNADMIVVMKDGQIVEKGTHNELMALKNTYHQLVNMQTTIADPKASDNDKSIDPASSLPENLDLASKMPETSIDSFQQLYDLQPASFARIMSLNITEWPYLLVGGLFSMIHGVTMVAFAMIFSEILKLLAETDHEKVKRMTRYWSLGFLGLGVVDFFALFLSTFLFGKAGEILIRKLRNMGFTATLRQDIAFFDEAVNSTGKLTAALAGDASKVNGVTSSRLNTFIQAIVMIFVSFIYAFYYSWKLTLLVIGFGPFLLLGGAAYNKIHTNFADGASKALGAACSLANEAVMNIRTIASVGKEYFFTDQYMKLVLKPYKKSLLKACVFGLSYSLTDSVYMLANAATFSLGGKLVHDQEITFDEMLKALFASVFGAIMAGSIVALAPDYTEAKLAAARLFRIIDREPKIDNSSRKSLDAVIGNITYNDISFNYPTRPEVDVLNHFSLNVRAGQKIALVGTSGCGKSTTINLLERFYDPTVGVVKIDDCDIKELDIQWLRSQLGLVSQEPVLFSRTIKENILYGLNRQVDDVEIQQAAMNANIHDFIISLPKGYHTMVGEKGTLISGGQKQRIAIARALIRNPKIMLLDEATSALDSESEKIVQQALDVAMEGRTSLIIAHRLSTIQNADQIVVIQSGKIVEIGTHKELLEKEGAYYLFSKGQI